MSDWPSHLHLETCSWPNKKTMRPARRLQASAAPTTKRRNDNNMTTMQPRQRPQSLVKQEGVLDSKQSKARPATCSPPCNRRVRQCANACHPHSSTPVGPSMTPSSSSGSMKPKAYELHLPKEVDVHQDMKGRPSGH